MRPYLLHIKDVFHETFKIKQTLKTQLTKIIFSVQMGRTQEIFLICFTFLVLISTQDDEDEDLDTDEIIRYDKEIKMPELGL